MGENLVGKHLYNLVLPAYTRLIVLPTIAEGTEAMRNYATMTYMGEILLMRNCECGNQCLCYLRTDSTGVDIMTYDSKGDATCWLVAETLVRCKCGRKYRTPNRRALRSIKIQEIAEARRAENCN